MQSETEESGKETLGTRFEVEVLSGCKRRVKASVPAEKVREELDKNYRQLTQNVQLPGFRKGRVPRKLLEARYGEEIEGDVKQSLLSTSLAEVVEEKDLKLVGSPRFDNIQFDRDSDLSYEVELEVRPEFELPSPEGLDIRPEPEPVTDAMVDERMEAIRQSRAQFREIDPSEAGAEDLHSGKYHLYKDGEKIKSSETVTFVPSRKLLDFFAVDDLPDRCASWDRSAPLVLDVQAPSTYEDEALRGSALRLEFTLEEARRIELPDIEALAKDLGAESPSELRDTVRRELERESLRAAEAEADERILDALLERTSMELPEGLLDAQKNRWRLEQEYKLLEKKTPPEEVKELLDKEDETAGEELKRGLKGFFILEKIAESERIFVTEREVDQRVTRFAALYGLPLDTARDELRRTGRFEEVRHMIRHEKVRALLRKKASPPPPAKVEEAPAPAAEAVVAPAGEAVAAPAGEAAPGASPAAEAPRADETAAAADRPGGEPAAAGGGS